MKVKLIKIGNSYGIRLPKTVIEESHLRSELELIPKENGVILKSVAAPREGWKDAIQADIDKRPVSAIGEWEW